MAARQNPALSPIVAGCWRLHEWGFGVSQRQRWIEQCIELGVSSFDHADIYGDHRVEGLFGEALRAAPSLRERLQIVTKFGIVRDGPHHPLRMQVGVKHYDSSAAHLRASVERSLREFATDRIDLLLLHRPDLLVQPDELAEAVLALRRDGKLLAFGLSNHNTAQFARLQRHLPLATHQIEFSPLQMAALADGTLDQCAELGIRPMAWSPLGRGRLFDTPGSSEQVLRVRAVLEAQARQRGASLATMAYAWILRHPSRPIPVTGSRHIERLREAVSALSMEITAEEWYAVWQASMGHEVA